MNLVDFISHNQLAAKISPEMLEAIKFIFSSGQFSTQREVAGRFDLSDATVSLIRRGLYP